LKDVAEILQTVQAKPHIISRKEKNCYLLVNRKNGAVLAVNDLGIEIWNMMKEKVMIKNVIEELAKKYDVAFEESKGEVMRFVRELSVNEFLEMHTV